MTDLTTLIIPGYHGSGKGHWQTWFEKRIPGAKRVEQEWEKPILAYWAQNIRQAIDDADGAVWLVAHSFGCLASVAASLDRARKVAGMMLVAPANPELFTPGGIRQENESALHENVRALLPSSALPFPCLIITSTDDPWMPHDKAQMMAECWGSRFITLGAAGHINIDSGFGSWPEGLQIFKEFQHSQTLDELEARRNNDDAAALITRGRGGYMARIRHITRRHFGY